MMDRSASFKAIALLGVFLAIAACTKKNTPDLEAGIGGPGVGDGGGAGIAAPGSKAEFDTTIGNKVYYLVDQSSLTPEGRDTLSRQAEWLKQYPNVTIQVEGHADERVVSTARHNIAQFPDLARCAGQSDFFHCLWQGKACGPV
jgi:peptidoglycan-associated lipoprotein